MFSLVFLKRLVEESAVMAVVAFGALFFVDGAGFTGAAAMAGGQAAARAVYGVIVKHFGMDKDRPSVG